MNNKMGKLFSVALLGVVLTSCLKDKNVEEKRYGTEGLDAKKIIEFTTDQSNFKSTALNFVNRDTVLNFAVVRLAAADPAPEDINVTLTLANSATQIADYNTANGASLVQFPTNLYAIQGNGLVVTIPKGSREGYLRLKVNPSTFDPSNTYALGFRIASVDKPGYTISQNFGNFLAAVGAKNNYDGNYQLRIKTVGWAAYGISDNLPGTWPSNPDGSSIHLITVGANSVKMFDAWGFHDYIQVAFTTGNAGATGFGATAPKFTFDPATNKLIDVSNDAPLDSRNRTFKLNPAVTDSRYDPATKTIYAAYLLTNTGRPDQQIFDTLTYKGSR